jgi:hypothetical protein
MTEIDKAALASDPAEPRWPAAFAIGVIALLYLALPDVVSLGPSWLVPTVLAVLITATTLSHRRGLHGINHTLGFVTSATLTVFLIWSLVLLVVALPRGKENAVLMLRSAASLWVSNVLVFALWYWRLDAGGPNGRDERAGHKVGAFLFPQMTEEGRNASTPSQRTWSPQFIDYLFLAFNTSTAFSPTDSPVLSRWAKGLTMIQSAISLCVIALLAGRAVNIL